MKCDVCKIKMSQNPTKVTQLFSTAVEAIGMYLYLSIYVFMFVFIFVNNRSLYRQ